MLARVWLGDIPERDDHGRRGEDGTVVNATFLQVLSTLRVG